MKPRIMLAMSKPSPLYLGIEGGATRSTLILMDAREHCIASLNGGPANLKLLSDRQLIWLLKSFANRLSKAAQRQLNGIAIGLAGARTEGDLQRIRHAANQVWPAVPCHATNDLETALAAAPQRRANVARILVLSGTGSCCFGRAEDGRTAKVGGRGHVIGDRGSACDIGQRSLKRLMSHYDHHNQWPLLGNLIMQALAISDHDQLIAWSIEATKTDIAALAICVFEAAKQGDRLAKDLLSETADNLAEDAHACALRLASPGEAVEFVYNGGVLLKNEAFATSVSKRLRRLWPKAGFVKVDHASSWGAARLALQGHPRPGGEAKMARPSTAKAKPDALPPDHPAFDTALLALSPTEMRNPKSTKLDKLSIPKAIELMLSEDATIMDALRAETRGITWVIKEITRVFQSGGHLYYVGAGTSGRLGVLDASECPPTFRAPREQVQGIIAGGQRALWSAVEGAEDDIAGGVTAIEFRGVRSQDMVIGIAASGRTPFVWGALAEAHKRGATTALVCFNPAFKKLPRRPGHYHPDRVIAPNLGPEVLTGSTRLKSGTATKLLCNLFTTLAMVQVGKVVSNLMVDLNPSNVKLRIRAIGIVRQLTNTDEAAAQAALEASGWVVKTAAESLMK
jgi:N-acetylmuramic acid 6-phosphate etherase